MTSTLTFVLVHGAWHGGWCWRRAAAILRDVGHAVTTPTLTGLGERAHLLSKDVGLATFIEDIANHIRFEDLADVILVGHSFGGLVIAGVADCLPERLRCLVYLDALNPFDGESWGSLMSEATRAERLRQAQAFSDGVSLPAPPPAAFGVERPDEAAWLEARLMPHPMGCLDDPVRLKNPAARRLSSAYIACAEPAYAPINPARARAEERGWPVHELRAGHDAMVTHPRETAALLVEAAETQRL